MQVTYSVNDGLSNDLIAPFNISTEGWSDGIYVVSINALDAVGLSISSIYEFVLDSTVPLISYNQNLNHTTIYDNITIPINISDLYLDSAFYKIDDGEYLEFHEPYVIDTKGWLEGSYIIIINANDSAGNEAEIWFEINIGSATDTTPPEILSTIPLNGSNEIEVNTTVIITFSESMSQVNTEFYISFSPYIEFDLEWDVTSTILYITFDQLKLKETTTYTLRIDSQIMDVIGNSMDSDFTLFFTTESISELDSDNDGIPDVDDPDDDNDGYSDESDDFPLDEKEWQDFDGDAIGDNADLDDDGDGVPDERDDFPLDPHRYKKETKQDLTIYILLLIIVVIISLVLILLFLRQMKDKKPPVEKEPTKVNRKELPPP